VFWFLHVKSENNAKLIYVTILFCSPPLFTPQTHYSDGEYIIRQGATGDTFFIISEGQVSKEPFWAFLLDDRTDHLLWIVAVLAHRWGSPSRNQPMRSQCSCPHCLEGIGLENMLSKGQWGTFKVISLNCCG